MTNRIRQNYESSRKLKVIDNCIKGLRKQMTLLEKKLHEGHLSKKEIRNIGKQIRENQDKIYDGIFARRESIKENYFGLRRNNFSCY